MALERYWDYAYSVSDQGNKTYHGPLEKQAAGGTGVQTSGRHYGILSSAWDNSAYFKSTTGYDHISMYDASSDATGTYHYGQSGGYKGRTENATKDVIGYDPVIGADATLSRGRNYFTKWIAESDYKDQDTTGRTLQTYRSDYAGKKRNEGYERVGGAVEVINFDQYMNDVGYADAARAMGIDSYTNLEQVHNAMAYMRGDYTPPAAEPEPEPIDNTLQTLTGDESPQNAGFVEALQGVTDSVTQANPSQDESFDYETAYNDIVKQFSGLQDSFGSQLATALAGQDTAFQNQLANTMTMQADSYATDLANALAAQQAGFDTQLSTINASLSTYQDQVKEMQEAAIKAQESMMIQAAYGNPGNLVGPSVTNVMTALSSGNEMGLASQGTTGTFNRDDLRIQSLNI